jgi:hypothetical protein
MKSSLKVGPVKKKAEKSELRPQLPGKHCPNCGEERERPSPGDHGTYPGWETWVESPHENPFDCIRFLKKELGFVRDDLKSVEKELSNVEAPRRDTFG